MGVGRRHEADGTQPGGLVVAGQEANTQIELLVLVALPAAGSQRRPQWPRKQPGVVPVGVDAVDDEQRRVAASAVPSDPRPAVAERAERFRDPLGSWLAGKLDDPFRVLVDPRHPAGLPPVELHVDRLEETVRPAGQLDDPLRYTARLRPD